MKKLLGGNRRLLTIIGFIVLVTVGFMVWRDSRPYQVGKDEVALYIRMDTREDIGLLVFDYTVDGHEHGGGISNADRSLIKHDETIINVWSREELAAEGDSMDLTLKIRVITEYVDPNFENIYPEEITERLNELVWKARFGEAYHLAITGNKDEGYQVVWE